MLSGPASIELIPTQTPFVKLAKLRLPIGPRRAFVLDTTLEVANAVQDILALEVVDYAE